MFSRSFFFQTTSPLMVTQLRPESFPFFSKPAFTCIALVLAFGLVLFLVLVWNGNEMREGKSLDYVTLRFHYLVLSLFFFSCFAALPWAQTYALLPFSVFLCIPFNFSLYGGECVVGGECVFCWTRTTLIIPSSFFFENRFYDCMKEQKVFLIVWWLWLVWSFLLFLRLSS